jgi:hypothetical protein
MHRWLHRNARDDRLPIRTPLKWSFPANDVGTKDHADWAAVAEASDTPDQADHRMQRAGMRICRTSARTSTGKSAGNG